MDLNALLLTLDQVSASTQIIVALVVVAVIVHAFQSRKK